MKKIILLFIFSIGLVLGSYAQQDLIQYVDPWIGTKGAGNTFPGACLPYGMVKLGPDCGDLLANSGFVHNEIVHGFSHTHVSGTGGGAKYGNILVMPFAGVEAPAQGCAKHYDHIEASPGYMNINFENVVDVHLTASHRVGFHDYRYDDSHDTVGVMIDPSSILGGGHCCEEAQELIGSELIILSDTSAIGYSRVRGGWNKGGAYTVFFAVIFDRPFHHFEIRQNDRKIEKHAISDNRESSQGYFFFTNEDGTQRVRAKVGISFVGMAKALENIETEIPHWNFVEVKQRAEDRWNELLNTIQVETETENEKTVFYTALYHTLLMPTNRTGENPKWTSDEPYYDDFYAIWDTYRATNPLLTLIQPEVERDIVRFLLDAYVHEGYMPDARSGDHTGRTQGGSNCDMLIADAYLKGITGIDYELAYEAMLKNAIVAPGDDEQKYGRGGIDAYIDLGYVPAEYEPESEHPTLHTHQLFDRAGTRTLEYAANDWAIAQVAKGMGKHEDYTKFRKRAASWSNLWRRVSCEGVTGFIWPKNSKGQWIEDFSAYKKGSWGNFFYEANAWEYSHYVPQDVRALIDSCGGRERFVDRLDHFFAQGHYKVDNEPSFFTPCLYVYAGRPDRTNEVIREIMDNHYTSSLDGIPGNDDAGSMSAWYVFNKLGFFPNAGQDVYIVTAPGCKSAMLDLGNGNTLEVIAHSLSPQNIYVKSVSINGVPLNRYWFRHAEIANGGTLEFEMTSKPIATDTPNVPPSMSDLD